jgi:hypothetical protein
MAWTVTTFKFGELSERYDYTKILSLGHREHIPILKLSDIKTFRKFTTVYSESQPNPCDRNIEFLDIGKVAQELANAH